MPRISELNGTAFPTLDHEFPTEHAGESVKLTIGQVRALMEFLATEIGYNAGTVAEALDDLASGKADLAALIAHAIDNGNPHGVTKAQVGLGNVDNTADTDKPVPQSMIDALALKLNISSVGVSGGAQTWSQKLTNLAALAGGADRLPYFTAANSLAQTTLTALARALLDDATYPAMWATLGGTQNNASTGYFKLPNDLILQWGVTNQPGAGDFTLGWGLTFPNAIRMAIAFPLFNNAGSNEVVAVNLTNLGVSNCSCRPRYLTPGAVTTTSGITLAWIAIGY